MSKVTKRLLSVLSSMAMMITMFSMLSVITASAATEAEDLAKVKEGLKNHFRTAYSMKHAKVQDAATYLANQKADGTWEDIDYYDTTNDADGALWQPYLALHRMQAMALAYITEGHEIYQNDDVITAIERGVAHWFTIRDANPNKNDYAGPWCVNWWANDNGVARSFAQTGLFVWDKLSTETINLMCSKMPTYGSKDSGQNAMWATQNALFRNLLQNNVAQFRKVVNECLAVNLAVVGLNGEGVQVDNSYHCHGNLMYSNGYGLTQFTDLAFWIYLLNDTAFELPQSTIDLMAEYFLNGTRWMIRGDLLEIGQGYKTWPMNSTFYAGNLDSIKKMAEVDTKNSAGYQAVYDNLTGKRKDNGLVGNNYMWTSALMAHMEEDYGINVRFDHAGMKSVEWRTEWDDACLNFWATAGALSVTVDGDEYRYAFPTYDWRHIPGTTTPYYYSNRENDFDNGNDDVIGVSNGKQGAVSYKYDKTDVRQTSSDVNSGATTGGRLGYFFFGEEYVALGTDLHSNHNMPIHSTINQVKSENPSVNGVAVPAETYDVAYEADWVYNDQIAYIFPQTTTVKVGNQDQKGLYINTWNQDLSEADVFSLWIDHGVKPTNGEYAYIALPSVTEAEAAAYAESNPITILANTKEMQAVSHSGLKQTQICFYGPGEFEYAEGKSVKVTEACSLIIDESGATPVVSMAISNTKQNTSCEAFLTIDGVETRTVMKSGANPYAGQSATMPAGDSTLITSGESAANSSLGLAFDGNTDTVWTAATLADSFIEYDMQTALDLNGMTLTFGDNYATAYEVLTSADGEIWTSAHKTTTGDGGEDKITLSATGQYWKLAVTATATGGGVDVKEITFTDKDFPYATPTYPDMTALKAEIADIVNTDLYSEDTLAVYHAAIAKANKLLVLPYATDELVAAMITEIQQSKANLALRELGSVMATVNLNPTVLEGQKKTLSANWTKLNTSLDLSERDLSKIYLFFTMDLECDDLRSGMFSSGRFILRSPNAGGKEHNVYILINNFDIQVGENIFYIPLSNLTKTTNTIDWSNVDAFRLYVDSLNQYDVPVKMTFSEIQILDSEYRPVDSAEKVELKNLLKAQRTELTDYTVDSVNAYNTLFTDGWAIYKDIEATEDEVKAILARVKKADELLVLDESAKTVVAALYEGEKQSSEGHYCKTEIKLSAPVDVSTLEAGKTYLQFDFKAVTTQPATNVDWMKYFRNGAVSLIEDKGTRGTEHVVLNKLHANQLVTANDAYVTLRYEIPAAILAKGNVATFYMDMYNDTENLNPDASGIEWNNKTGVTFTVRNVKILADKADEPIIPTVDKAALNAAITEAEKVTDLSVYTDDSAKAFTDALAAAKSVAAKADATQTEVDNAKKALEAAQAALTLKPVEPEITLGDVNENGSVTAEDALMALQIATNKINPTDDQKSAADVDKNGDVTANDALLILQFATKKIDQF